MAKNTISSLLAVILMTGMVLIFYFCHVLILPETPLHTVPEPKEVYYISCAFGVPGLGNLIFQYASLIGIAHLNVMTPIVSRQLPLHSVFKLPVRVSPDPRPGIPWGKVIELKASSYDSLLVNLPFQHNIELVGFLQSWMYFANVKEELMEHFQFHDHIKRGANDFLINAIKQLKNDQKIGSDVTFVGVHIRRGDFLLEQFSSVGYTVATPEYIEKAIKFYEELFPNIIFVVCGSDPEWNRAVVKPKHGVAVFSSQVDEAADLALLAQCNHTIITVGTYGWWAATLAGGHVVYYQDFPHNGSDLSRRAFSPHRKDYYPAHWTPLS